MASQLGLEIETDKALFTSAARVARDKCQLHKFQIAARAGMTARMLHRLTTGTTRATDRQRERILQACNLPTMTSRLLAESKHAELIGTGAHDWLERFMHYAITNLASIRLESGMEIEGQWAASDAALIFARWQTVIDQRRTFMADYFAAECLGVRDRDR